MKWRVRADIIVSDKGEVMSIFDFLEVKKGSFETINKGKPNEERSRVSVEKCYHDEEPPKPCEILETVESE